MHIATCNIAIGKIISIAFNPSAIDLGDKGEASIGGGEVGNEGARGIEEIVDRTNKAAVVKMPLQDAVDAMPSCGEGGSIEGVDADGGVRGEALVAKPALIRRVFGNLLYHELIEVEERLADTGSDVAVAVEMV